MNVEQIDTEQYLAWDDPCYGRGETMTEAILICLRQEILLMMILERTYEQERSE